jgi:hypothetical protein
LVVDGGKDVIIYPINSYILQQELPNAQLILCPDSAHCSLELKKIADMACSADAQEGIAAFVAKRSQQFSGRQES